MPAASTKKSRILTGIQPSGDMQLGNYLGAVKRWVANQDIQTNFIPVVDLHSITVKQDPEELRRQTVSLVAMLIACGVDPEKSTLFIQSHVSAHAVLSWVLNCTTPVGWLERMIQYKEKSHNQERVSTGLLTYPVLMAADILIYDADEVPVGEDQKQHVELTRDIAERFNNIYGQTFVLPEAVVPEVGARVMGLDNPLIKMSKSHAHIRGHAISMLDDPKEIERSIKRSVTDSFNEICFSNEKERAGVNNLLGIYQVITQKTEQEVESDFKDARGYGDLKSRVSDTVISEIEPITKRYYELINDPAELGRLIQKGDDSARQYADPKLDIVLDKVGLHRNDGAGG
ncbi:MAG: tryptophan--tRNA ligase [Chloroflexota bacterium]|jgi:tryptophanyl-tRNA synthetase|tara:strand:+ start:10346 stop:11377 length:1032 start_codon:yes stop_codon:yes gene_type:complete